MSRKRKEEGFFGLSQKQIAFLEKKMESLLPTEDKEGRKAFGGVFDGLTLQTIFKLFHTPYLEDFEFPIATGKEADVFCGRTKDGKLLAVKIFRINTSSFKNMLPYIEGDRRFSHLKKGAKNISRLWAKKEFKNLHRLHQAGVSVPEPIYLRDNIILMEYIGDEVTFSPDLKSVDLEPDQYKRIFENFKTYLYLMYNKAELVHADLSEYNILFWKDKIYIIDVGQAVLKSHPNAQEFLKRDIKNMVRFFTKKGVDAEEKELWNYIHE
ncbi:MAG TPA: serine protein kinase RIO [Thermoplasmata archaeon]|nr:serine protein kinase RIO [Thermoplasmata archaeon]